MRSEVASFLSSNNGGHFCKPVHSQVSPQSTIVNYTLLTLFRTELLSLVSRTRHSRPVFTSLVSPLTSMLCPTRTSFLLLAVSRLAYARTLKEGSTPSSSVTSLAVSLDATSLSTSPLALRYVTTYLAFLFFNEFPARLLSSRLIRTAMTMSFATLSVTPSAPVPPALILPMSTLPPLLAHARVLLG